ncbi:MAG: HYR domain-containing protein, partial [Thaumarchaeota archaeon]|nr:HYR domain-containing protein [Nitrososphaerota archaeon]
MTNDAPKSFPIGMTTVTWTAKDTSGNTANATQTVVVKDTTAPNLTPPPNVTFEATSVSDNTVPIGNATATDIEPVTITNNASKTFPLGKTTILWIAKDTSNNKVNATQTVDVVDTTAPKITPPANITFEATSLDNNTVPIGNATATDIEPVTITNNASKTFPLGKTTILWTAKDTSGNTANTTQIIDVTHTIPPKITPPPNVTFEATSVSDNTVPIGNATATDIEPVIITNNASKTFPLGKTTILWTAKDTSGNTANTTQVVAVVHTIPPKITAPTAITIEATSLDNNTVPLGSPTVTDIEQVTMTNDAPKSFPIGMTTVTWTAKDTSGNTANATQTVVVKDTTAPNL